MLLTTRGDEGGNRSVPGEPVVGSRPATLRSFGTARPAPDARPAQPSAVPSRPGRSSRGSSTHRSLGGGPRTGRGRAAGLAGGSGAHGAHAAGAVYTRDPVPPPGAARVVPPAEQRRQAPPPLPTDSSYGPALFLALLLGSRSLRPQPEWTVSAASHSRQNAGGPRTCPLPSL